jgi:hypothetical protein
MRYSLNIRCCTIFIFGFLCVKSFSQIESTEIYGGVGYYRHTGFDGNSYFHARGGLQLFSYKFFSPEVDFTYYFGGYEVIGNRDFETNFPISILKKDFQGSIIGISPKLFFGDSELRLVLVPKYHFGSTRVEGIVTRDTNPSTIRQRLNSKLNFWSFSVGLEGELENERFKLGAYLTYTGFNAGRTLNDITFEADGFENSRTNTSTLGLAIRLSYRLWGNSQIN